MQTRRRLFAVIAALCIAPALFAGCSSGSKQSGPPLPDAGALVKQSSETTKNVKSAHVVLSVNGKITGLPIKTLTADLTNVPAVAASGNASITLGGSDIDANFVVVDGNLFATLTPNKWSDFGKASDIYDISAILSPEAGLGNVLANLTDAKAVSRENLNGQNTIQITGNVTADAVNKIAPPFNATKAVPATVWIQEAGEHQLVQAKLEKSPGNAVQMTLSNWGAPVTVTKPQLG